ncbi:DUF6417 family protein (plasmid) [Streptomyces sp. NBC_00015]|uniref:DUF6417 family protein n=1 Tax=Streptomyces sp. NBC_00015 TaxID=2903611 RepID=UPI002F90FEF1
MAADDKTLDLLRTVEARRRGAEHGWAVDAVLAPVKQRVLNLADRGLIELADREERAALSAWEGRPVRWAARLAPDGHDLLLYAASRPRHTAPAGGPGPEHRRVELCLSQMAALWQAVSLGARLRRPLADGLTDEVRTACCDHRVKRWVLHLTDDQIASVAYVFWLHKTTGSALEANRFARDTGVTHRPAPARRTAIPERTPLLHRPPSAVPADDGGL